MVKCYKMLHFPGFSTNSKTRLLTQTMNTQRVKAFSHASVHL